MAGTIWISSNVTVPAGEIEHVAKNSFTPLQYSYHNWTRQAFISPKAFSPLEQRYFSGKAEPMTVQPREHIMGGLPLQRAWLESYRRESSLRNGRQGERWGPTSTGGTHLSSKEPSWVLAVLYSPACVADRHEPSPETFMMDTGNSIPTESLPMLCLQESWGPKTLPGLVLAPYLATERLCLQVRGPGLLNAAQDLLVWTLGS